MYVYFDANGTLKEIISDKSFRVGDSKKDKIYVYWDGEHTPVSGWVKYRKPNGREYPDSVEECFFQFGDNLVGKALPSKPLRNLKYFSYDHTYEENGETHVGYKFYEITIPDEVLNSSMDDEKIPNENNMVIARIRFVMDNNKNGKVDEADSIETLGALVFSVETNIGILTDSSINETQYNYLIQLVSMKLGTNTKSVKVSQLPSTGVAGTIYYVEKENGGIVYDAYFWNGTEFVFMGTTSYGLYTKQEGDDFKIAIQELWTAEMNDYEALINGEFETYKSSLNAQMIAWGSLIQATASGSPKGVYATLTALQNAFPTGTNGIYVVSENGHWYYWNGSAWSDGGVYQARELGDGSVKYGNISDALQNVISDKKTVSCYTIDISSSTSGATGGTFWTSNNLSFTKGVTIARLSFNSSISGSGTIAIAKPSGANYEIIDSFPIDFISGLNNVDLDYYCNENVFVFLDCAVKYGSNGIYSLIGFSKSGNTLTQSTGLNNANFAVSVLYFESKSLDEKYKKMLHIKDISKKAYGEFTSSDQIPLNQIWGQSLLSASSGSIIKNVTLKDMNVDSKIKIYLAEKNNGVLEKKEEYIFSFLKSGDNICNINFYCEKETYVLFEPLTPNAGFKFQSSGGAGSLDNYSLSNNTFTQTQSLQNWQLYAELEITALTGNIGNVLEVSKKGDKDFQTINEALNFAYSIESRENPITILVYPSVYKEVCNVGGNHFVSIVGINKNDCIIRDDSGVYNNAPIRICGNAYIANLTIIATHNDDNTYETKTRNPESFDDTNGSYALHIDDLHANDNYDYLTVVENCYLYSEQNAAIGIGMQKNMTLKVINCECVKKVSDAIYNHTVLRTGKFGAIFFHNVSLNQYGGNSGYQKFIMDNCRLKVNKGVCFNTENLGSGGTITFYNNILYSDELGKTNVYSNVIPNSLTEDSFGNNINDMNSN